MRPSARTIPPGKITSAKPIISNSAAGNGGVLPPSTMFAISGSLAPKVETIRVRSSRALGASTTRILFRHLIPHLIPTIIVYATLGVATTVLLEAMLSFLGRGVQPPTPAWGMMIFESQSYFLNAPWLVFIPGAAILIVALAFNLAGDGLRDALDPTQRGRR